MKIKKFTIINCLVYLWSIKHFLLLIIALSIFFSSIFWSFFYNKQLKTSLVISDFSFTSIHLLESNLFEKKPDSNLILDKLFTNKIKKEILSKKNLEEYLQQKNLPKDLVKLTFEKNVYILKHPIFVDGLSFQKEYFLIVQNKFADFLDKEFNLFSNNLNTEIKNLNKLNFSFGDKLFLKKDEKSEYAYIDKTTLILILNQRIENVKNIYYDLRNFELIDEFIDINVKQYYSIYEFILNVCLLIFFISVVLFIYYNFFFKNSFKL
jgi:hypothetical protein